MAETFPTSRQIVAASGCRSHTSRADRATVAGVEIPAEELGARADEALAAARNGDDVLVTVDGIAVARLSAVESADLMTRLAAEGVINIPASERAVPRLPQAEAAKDALSSLLGRLRR